AAGLVDPLVADDPQSVADEAGDSQRRVKWSDDRYVHQTTTSLYPEVEHAEGDHGVVSLTLGLDVGLMKLGMHCFDGGGAHLLVWARGNRQEADLDLVGFIGF